MKYGLALQRQIYIGGVLLLCTSYPETHNWVAFFIELHSCCAISTCVFVKFYFFLFMYCNPTPNAKLLTNIHISSGSHKHYIQNQKAPFPSVIDSLVLQKPHASLS